MYLKQKTNNKKYKKKIILVAAAVILGLIIVFIIIQTVNSQKNNSSSSNSQTNQSTSTQTQNGTSNSNDPKKTKQYEGEDPNVSNELTGSITSAFIANGNFSLRVNINQFISGGTCTLTMTKGDIVITKTAPIVAAASTSTCQGFDSADAEFSSGTWHAKIDLLSSDNKKGIIEGEVNL